ATISGDPFRLAILDVQVLEADGLSLAHAIKNDPAIAATKLLILGSLGQRAECAQLQAAGIALGLTKPVKQMQLRESLAQMAAQQPVDAEVISFNTHLRRQTSLNVATSLSFPERRKGTKILIAEDNIVNQKVTLFQLKKLGYSADAVANGHEAVEALARIPYDLVLMDCHMPEMNGYQATAEIRRREGPAKHTIIIAMTAAAMDGDRELCLAAGMDDHIGKPVDLEDLNQALMHWLEEKV
ncbi:MAG TPA: response regulator, partial [Blastocatellia bacterium]|nr:response regulator [Blastocatellia bacterium]